MMSDYTHTCPECGAHYEFEIEYEREQRGDLETEPISADVTVYGLPDVCEVCGEEFDKRKIERKLLKEMK